MDTARLDVTVTEGERCLRTLKIDVPEEIIAEERRAVTRKYASRVKLKGFRKGKVPAHVIARRYGRIIEEDAVEQSLRKACDEAIAAHGMHPVTDVDVTDVRLAPEGSLSFEASFAVRPTVPLGRLGGFRVERPRVEVPDEATDQILERLRGENAAWRTEENGQPQPGDSVTVGLTRLDVPPEEASEEDAASRQYDFVLGEGQALPDIEDAVSSLATGEEGDFGVAFPPDFPDESRRGEHRRIRIELLARRVPELPELDDGFARSVGNFEDLDALKARIAEDIERDLRSRAEAEVNDRLMRFVVEANPFEIPDSMVEAYTDALVKEAEGVDPEKLQELREEIRPVSEFAVKREFLADRIVDEHGLRPSRDEVNARVEALAREIGEPRGKVFARLRKSGSLRSLERSLTEAKFFDFLRDQSEITEAP